MDMMSVLFGMAFGGLLMSSTRAAVILVVATFLYGVVFSVHQWVLLGAVFLLTLFALYGLGMVLASLFVMWGREVWHMNQLLQEPVYFVSGVNFPVNRLGYLGALAIALIPLAVGLDAMRQLAFDAPPGTSLLAPQAEAVLLVAMVAIFLVFARVMLRVMERMARREGRLSARGR
jgi:ABC-2 type transport system permease protein